MTFAGANLPLHFGPGRGEVPVCGSSPEHAKIGVLMIMIHSKDDLRVRYNDGPARGSNTTVVHDRSDFYIPPTTHPLADTTQKPKILLLRPF